MLLKQCIWSVQLKAERLSHASTKRALERVEAEVRKLKLNTAEAFEEFGELQAKLEIEADLRTHAEELAAQVGVVCAVCVSACLPYVSVCVCLIELFPDSVGSY
jgi:hypothetical protein